MSYNPNNPNGQATMANSAPVVVASDQSAVPVSGTVTANAGTNLNTSALATSANLTAGTQKTQVVDGSGNVISSTSNALDVNIKTNNAGSVVSTNNSSSTNITGNASFTGTSEDVTQYSEMRVSVYSSHASATDGLSIQQSSDGTNWDITDPYTIPATTAKTFVVPRQAKFFRVVYTNGATTTTSFRLQTILNRTGSASSSQRAQDAYTNETDLVQGQSFLMGFNGTTWDRLRTTGTGVLSTSSVLTAGSAIVGKVGIDQTTPGTTNAVVDTPTTAGGLSIVTGSVGATATAIKASAGQLYGYHLFNTTAAVAYVQIFNVASGSVALGTTAPTMSIGIPASGGVTVNFDKGIAFGTAISFACTTTRTGSTGATCDVNFFYK